MTRRGMSGETEQLDGAVEAASEVQLVRRVGSVGDEGPPRSKAEWWEQLVPGAPRCVANIVVMEACERFSYYGFRAILVLYLAQHLGMSDGTAVATYSMTSSVAYASPVLGGWLADSKVGKESTIKWLGGVYCVGLWLLVWAATQQSVWLSLVALGLVGIGTGGIKPCVSSFGADQLKRGDDEAVRRYFAVFYASINVGSVGSFAVVPSIKAEAGYAAAFALPAALLVAALATFTAASGSYVRRDATVESPREAARRKRVLLAGIGARRAVGHDERALRRVFLLLATLPVFWSLYDQQGSVWVVQAKDMRTHGLQPEQLGIVNPILILGLLPLFEKLIYPKLSKSFGVCSPPSRIKAGMAVAALAFFVAAWVDLHASNLHVLWQLPQIFLISIAEILVSVTGLETSYAWAPPHFKSIVTSAFLLTTAVGDAGAGLLYATLKIDRTKFLFLCAVLMLANVALFARVVNSTSDDAALQHSDLDHPSPPAAAASSPAELGERSHRHHPDELELAGGPHRGGRTLHPSTAADHNTLLEADHVARSSSAAFV